MLQQEVSFWTAYFVRNIESTFKLLKKKKVTICTTCIRVLLTLFVNKFHFFFLAIIGKTFVNRSRLICITEFKNERFRRNVDYICV